MPRRKKLPEIPDYFGITDKQTVQKSNPLQSLSQTSLTLSDLKILDAYLSRINSHTPDKRYVRFEKGELEKLLNVDRIRQDALEQRLKNLFQVVTIRDANKPKGFKLVALFEQAEATQDANGLWQVDLACTGSAMEYVFNVENLGYLKYRLKNIVDLTSRYTYVLYLYLENNRFRKTWEIEISELRKILNCTADTYDQYKRLNDLILKKCFKEINEKTTISYVYEPCRKRGRKYTAIKFTVKNTEELDYNNLLPDYAEWDANANRSLWVDAIKPLGFTPQELEEIEQLLALVPTSLLPADPNGLDNVEIRKYHYIALKVARYNTQMEKKPIKHKFAYFKAMLEKDIKEGF